MKIEQIYTGCLAQGAYYIESAGEAAIIDPLREVQPYIELAAKRNAKIKYIFETHFHADFVSGHIDLANKTGAAIVYGPTKMKTGFEFMNAEDGTIFQLGLAKIKVIHTPGHTLESSCFLLIDESGKETALFTGDTLFIGDVGRPDLAQHVIADLTEEKLAGYLYDSLRTKIMPLSDSLIIYPAHGAGSACGKNLSKETSDTLGNQKKTNYALREGLSKETFIKELLSGLTTPPYYFPKNVLLNIKGYDSFDTVLERGIKQLSVSAFDALSKEAETLVIDTRKPQVFAKGFIPNSINLGIDGNFAVWVGTLIPNIEQHILIVADPGREKEVVTRLARVGYDHAIGCLEGGFESWIKSGLPMDTIPAIDVNKFAEAATNNPAINILDVRKKSEYDSEHIVNAINVPLDYIHEHMEQIDKNKTYYVHCAGGYRSMIFSSILKARGYHHLIDVDGGFQAIKNSGKFKITDFVCPTTML
ncbi:MAG: MBL fold metallo-hydrolase [Saprospiraceae bacterium]|nr:MBL fold metallo-hydrolase [Saprospiraceae bacterium]MBK8449084.1 MBL fold metallo-hydrolase [Saprospiraceae bacterium]MBK9720844.1 MBL fold metallo-hydrolase [Saprospiraceae bacterium]MBK9727840.1 MBL fold metallo-hydrolase [Saprospiraceae bacterium]